MFFDARPPVAIYMGLRLGDGGSGSDFQPLGNVGGSSALLFGRNYPPFVPNFGENVALSRENDHKFESLLRYNLYGKAFID